MPCPPSNPSSYAELPDAWTSDGLHASEKRPDPGIEDLVAAVASPLPRAGHHDVWLDPHVLELPALAVDVPHARGPVPAPGWQMEVGDVAVGFRRVPGDDRH